MSQIRAFVTAAAAGLAAAVLTAGMPAIAGSSPPAPKPATTASGGHAQPKCTAEQIRVHRANCPAANQAHPQPARPKSH